MKKLSIIKCILVFYLLSCNNEKGELVQGNYIAKGNIRDSVFEGLIKFYDKNTGQLEREGYYKNNILNGPSKKYHDNGKLEILTSYSDGKMNGYSDYYDITGNLSLRYYTYYDIRTGPSLEYKNGKVTDYYYYPLENQTYCHINYDSIGKKGLLEIATNFFFAYSYRLKDAESWYWISNVNPPKYNFQYSLVTVDKKNNIQNIIKPLKLNSDLWYQIEISDEMMNDTNYLPAIKIDVTDSINGLNCVMLRHL